MKRQPRKWIPRLTNRMAKAELAAFTKTRKDLVRKTIRKDGSTSVPLVRLLGWELHIHYN